jgi:hypothetical protein
MPDPATTGQPKHALPALTTYELRDYRRELETAIAFYNSQDPVPPARVGLQALLDAVIAEQDDRAEAGRRCVTNPAVRSPSSPPAS